MRRYLAFSLISAAFCAYAPMAMAQAVYEPAAPAASAPQAGQGMQDQQSLVQPNNLAQPGDITPLEVPAAPPVAGTSSTPVQSPAAVNPPGAAALPAEPGTDVQEPEEGDMGEQPKTGEPPAPVTVPPQAPLPSAKPGENGDTQFSSVVLQGLNKVTAHAETIIAPIGSVVRFGTMEIVAHTCWKSAPEDRPENAALLEISEIKQGEAPQQIFLGWMFSSSPGLSALEHPFYDITVVKCSKTGGEDLGEEPKPAKDAAPAKPAKKPAVKAVQ